MPTISFRLTDEQHEFIKGQAKRLGISQSAYVKQAALSGGGEENATASGGGSACETPAPTESVETEPSVEKDAPVKRTLADIPPGVRRGAAKEPCPKCGSLSTHFSGCAKGPGPVA